MCILCGIYLCASPPAIPMRKYPIPLGSNGSLSFSPEIGDARVNFLLDWDRRCQIPLGLRCPGCYSMGLPDDIPCRTHTSSGKNSRWWWNLETFLSVDFGPWNRTRCAWRLVQASTNQAKVSSNFPGIEPGAPDDWYNHQPIRPKCHLIPRESNPMRLTIGTRINRLGQSVI